jgi:hypothetical protein
LYLGKFYYLKDLGVIFCFFTLGGIASAQKDKVSMLVAAAAVALMFIFIPALPKDDSLATGLTIMWIMKWGLAAQLGILVCRERLQRELTVMVAVLVGLIVIDGVIGLWEIRNQTYYFTASAEEITITGASILSNNGFGDLIRIHGIHRSPGDFGNAMALGMMVTAYLLLVCGQRIIRAIMLPLLLLFAYVLFFSTLRSFLVGGAFAVLALVCATLGRRLFDRRLAHITLGLILACLFFSDNNIIPAVEFVSKHVLSGFAIGDVNSSYERLDSWDDVIRDIRAAPIVIIIGGPLAAALSLDAPPSNICDNIFLWIFYHTGIFGLLGFVIVTPMPLTTRTDPRGRALYFGAAVQVLVTGIFTDSLFYFSSVLMFFALGLILGELRAPRLPIFTIAPRPVSGVERSAESLEPRNAVS